MTSVLVHTSEPITTVGWSFCVNCGAKVPRGVQSCLDWPKRVCQNDPKDHGFCAYSGMNADECSKPCCLDSDLYVYVAPDDVYDEPMWYVKVDNVNEEGLCRSCGYIKDFRGPCALPCV